MFVLRISRGVFICTVQQSAEQSDCHNCGLNLNSSIFLVRHIHSTLNILPNCPKDTHAQRACDIN